MATAQSAYASPARKRARDAVRKSLGRLVQYRTYRRTVRGLSGMTDTELRKIGLSRGMIRSVARETALAA
ncbi:DUF1127 domain-containing protein [Tropicimonas marinistellae]|uniref:DUF1127 domain-containing protein n=1 Tax=Tropicimonas marinistellae TaxID=1739787 RepID=UPI0009903135|nr:DUF1127 domain-containing protein [Tropicimonas marinistellae]